MRDKYEVEYNGSTSGDYGLFLYDYPEIAQAEKNVETYHVMGRDGELICDHDTYGNRTIQCTFSIISDMWLETFRDAKKWLLGEGNGVLRFSDDPEYYYRVKMVSIDTPERELRKFGTFAVTFTCDPYQYALDGDVEMDAAAVRYNSYATSHPTYIIRGNGLCMLCVNGKSMKAEIAEDIVIDTERSIAHQTDGTVMNTAVFGEYQDLYLKEGSNEITVTEGFELRVIPHWRCI